MWTQSREWWRIGRLVFASIMQSDTRLRGRTVWEMLVLAHNGLVFILSGLQFATVLGGRGRAREGLTDQTQGISVASNVLGNRFRLSRGAGGATGRAARD